VNADAFNSNEQARARVSLDVLGIIEAAVDIRIDEGDYANRVLSGEDDEDRGFGIL
jgi:hypothetical protein